MKKLLSFTLAVIMMFTLFTPAFIPIPPGL